MCVHTYINIYIHICIYIYIYVYIYIKIFPKTRAPFRVLYMFSKATGWFIKLFFHVSIDVWILVWIWLPVVSRMGPIFIGSHIYRVPNLSGLRMSGFSGPKSVYRSMYGSLGAMGAMGAHIRWVSLSSGLNFVGSQFHRVSNLSGPRVSGLSGPKSVCRSMC